MSRWHHRPISLAPGDPLVDGARDGYAPGLGLGAGHAFRAAGNMDAVTGQPVELRRKPGFEAGIDQPRRNRDDRQAGARALDAAA